MVGSYSHSPPPSPARYAFTALDDGPTTHHRPSPQQQQTTLSRCLNITTVPIPPHYPSRRRSPPHLSHVQTKPLHLPNATGGETQHQNPPLTQHRIAPSSPTDNRQPTTAARPPRRTHHDVSSLGFFLNKRPASLLRPPIPLRKPTIIRWLARPPPVARQPAIVARPPSRRRVRYLTDPITIPRSCSWWLVLFLVPPPEGPPSPNSAAFGPTRIQHVHIHTHTQTLT